MPSNKAYTITVADVGCEVDFVNVANPWPLPCTEDKPNEFNWLLKNEFPTNPVSITVLPSYSTTNLSGTLYAS